MQKRAWNGSTEEWIHERHYTKDEVDSKVGAIEELMPHTLMTATINYVNGSSQTIRFLADEIEEEEE
jgi:hypothetical protein